MNSSISSSKIYKIVVACGTAIATSTHVAIKIKELYGFSTHVLPTILCRVTEVPSLAPDADLIIATAQVPFDINVPVVDGIPFLTGIGIEEVTNKIETILTAK